MDVTRPRNNWFIKIVQGVRTCDILLNGIDFWQSTNQSQNLKGGRGVVISVCKMYDCTNVHRPGPGPEKCYKNIL